MDNNNQPNQPDAALPPTQPASPDASLGGPVVNQPEPVVPAQTMTPQPIAPEPPLPAVEQPIAATPPTESSGKSPLLYGGLVLFFLVLGGATYYVLQPQDTSETSVQPQQVTYTTPEPTAIPTLSEEQELDTAVSYSLDDSFAELEKDLQQL